LNKTLVLAWDRATVLDRVEVRSSQLNGRKKESILTLRIGGKECPIQNRFREKKN